MSEFSQKVALVTGAGGGIGRATALAFAAQGTRVMVADIDVHAAEQTVELVRAAGGEAVPTTVDVANERSVRKMVGETARKFGCLNYAVNNAGIDPEITAEPQWNIEEFDRILAINLRGVVLCLKAELEIMRPQGSGSIVNMASFAGVCGVASKPFYTAAKHGVVGLTKAVGLDQAKYGIRVNAVCPGFTKTSMALANTSGHAGALEAIEARNPTRRVAEADEMAAAILFLCSGKSNFIVGQSLSVDGGISVQ